MVDLRVRIGPMTLANPVMPASGTFDDTLARVMDLSVLGALVTKTVTRELRGGNPVPRVAETAQGMLNSIGIPSKGVVNFVRNVIPRYAGISSPLVVSVSAPTVEGFAQIARQVSQPGVAAIEANISCPNLEKDGCAFAMRPDSTLEVVRAIRAATTLPLWAKLTPNTGDIAAVAAAAESAGADAIVVANTVLAMAIDVETRIPKLGSVLGGLSGPAIKPMIVRMVHQCHRAVRIPVIGCGGIESANDAIEYMLAGATAVQIGTATFRQPLAMRKVLAELVEYCLRHGIAGVAELTGAVTLPDEREMASSAAF